MTYRKTGAAADEIGVPPYRLADLIRARKLAPPAKDSSGDFVWTDEDIARAREALAAGRRKAAVAGGAR